jgi:flagellar basal-body rod protein FlgG
MILWHIDCTVIGKAIREQRMGYEIIDVANAGARAITQLNSVANNLANSSTSGYKAENIFYRVMKEASAQGKNVDNSWLLVANHKVEGVNIVDFSQGTLLKTGNSLDAAIDGEGFFSIQQKNRTTYTRNSSFNISRNGELVTSNGLNVLGESGPIKINGKTVEIDTDGTVRVDGNITGKLKIVNFKNPAELMRAGDGQYVDNGNAGLMKAERYRVAGGYIEASNVNPIKEMIKMVDIQRDFETYQKVILTASDLDKISTNRIGKLI